MNESWKELPEGIDAIFVDGSDWLKIIYVNESANNGNGSFEIEYIDYYRVLELYDRVEGNSEDFFDLLPDVYQGEWYYCDNGMGDFDDLVEQFYSADFIGGGDEELEFIINWAKERRDNRNAL